MKKTIGIYSFPKSGNTWMRHILSSVLGLDRKALRHYIPDVHQDPICRNPVKIGKIDYFFYKSHTETELQKNRGQPVQNDLIIHIRRHPLDVFLSHMNYLSDNVTGAGTITFRSVDDIKDSKLFNAYFGTFVVAGTVQPRFRQAGSWYSHNAYWVSRAESGEGTKVCAIRYEDLLRNGKEEIAFLADYLPIRLSDIENAMTEADDRTKADGKFFWKRKVANFREYLTDEQINFFWEVRGADVEALGYTKDEF